MGDYVDPNETDPSTWRGSTPRDGRDGGRAAIRSVVERALATETPYQRTGTRVYGPSVVRAEFDSRDYTPVQGRLVELELVRNPPFARYRLDECGEWTEFGRPLTYDLDAFDAGP
jgi:hypothetical protein